MIDGIEKGAAHTHYRSYPRKIWEALPENPESGADIGDEVVPVRVDRGAL